MREYQGREIPVTIESEMKTSYLDYAMSVIVGRALPDVRDGLKPVHRRILYAMSELSNTRNRPHKKSARVVGEVIGKYHPHGDAAVYDALVRMAQDFSMREMLIDGQGNFGSIDGDSPAAMRYTEVRMAGIADEILADIEKETVEYQANYDESLQEPTVLPARIPNLLINGASGIAVGMATNVPPHNLAEVVDGLLLLLDQPDATLSALMQLIRGPDFPTAGIIYGRKAIHSAYATGRGIIQLRAKAAIEKVGKDKEAIIVDELPYQVNKARLIETIAALVRSKRIDGISDLRDESDRDGMRVVIELKRGEQPQIVLNQLYKLTPMQSSFGIIMLALAAGRPRVLTLKEMLNHFLAHRRIVVRRRTQYDLRKAEKRAHILEGLAKALDHLDLVIALIRGSRTPAEAKTQLIQRLEFTEIQAQAILEMRLQRLTGLERDKIVAELEQIRVRIAQLRKILTSEPELRRVIRDELMEIQDAYHSPRRTVILDEAIDLTIEDLIAEEQVVITATHGGYIKRTALHIYRSQHRGGKGRIGMSTRTADDVVDYLFVASTHSYILIFTNQGRVYWLKVYEIPDVGAAGKGKPIVNLVKLERGEKVADMIAVQDFKTPGFIVMASRQGRVKKTALSAYSRPMAKGIIACAVAPGDELIVVSRTSGQDDILLCTERGKAARFSESQVREMGRVAQGVWGVRLKGGDSLVSMGVIRDNHESILAVTEQGFGKRTPVDEYAPKGRAGQGVINIKTSGRNGKVAATFPVGPGAELIIVTAKGKIIRLEADSIRMTGRNAFGVKLMDLGDGDTVADVSLVAEGVGEVESEASE